MRSQSPSAKNFSPSVVLLGNRIRVLRLEKSAHNKQVNTALNETYRIITGCLRQTRVDKLQGLGGIAPSRIRRTIEANTERKKDGN